MRPRIAGTLWHLDSSKAVYRHSISPGSNSRSLRDLCVAFRQGVNFQLTFLPELLVPGSGSGNRRVFLPPYLGFDPAHELDRFIGGIVLSANRTPGGIDSTPPGELIVGIPADGMLS